MALLGSPEDEEFLEAEAILRRTLPRLPRGSPLSAIRALVLAPEGGEGDSPAPLPSSCMFWEGNTLLQVERLVVTPLDPLPVLAVSSGISRRDLGSGGKCWEGPHSEVLQYRGNFYALRAFSLQLSREGFPTTLREGGEEICKLCLSQVPSVPK